MSIKGNIQEINKLILIFAGWQAGGYCPSRPILTQVFFYCCKILTQVFSIVGKFSHRYFLLLQKSHTGILQIRSNQIKIPTQFFCFCCKILTQVFCKSNQNPHTGFLFLLQDLTQVFCNNQINNAMQLINLINSMISIN